MWYRIQRKWPKSFRVSKMGPASRGLSGPSKSKGLKWPWNFIWFVISVKIWTVWGFFMFAFSTYFILMLLAVSVWMKVSALKTYFLSLSSEPTPQNWSNTRVNRLSAPKKLHQSKSSDDKKIASDLPVLQNVIPMLCCGQINLSPRFLLKPVLI